VFVALLIQREKRIRSVMLSSVFRLALQYFSPLRH